MMETSDPQLHKALLEKELEKLKVLESLERAKAHVKALAGELEIVMREKLQLEQEVLETEERRLVLVQSMLLLKEENLGLKETEASCKTRIRDLELETDGLRTTISQLEHDKVSLRAEVDRLEQLAKTADAETERLEFTVQEEGNKTKILSHEILRLAENKLQLEKQLRALKDAEIEISIHKDELDRKASLVHHLERRINELESEIAQSRVHSTAVSSLNSQIDQLKYQLDNSQKALAYSEDLLAAERSAILRIREQQQESHPVNPPLVPDGNMDAALARLVTYADSAKKSEVSVARKLQEAEMTILWLRKRYLALHHQGKDEPENFEKIASDGFYQSTVNFDAVLQENQKLKQELQSRRPEAHKGAMVADKTALLETAVRDLERERAALLVRVTVAEEQVKYLSAGLKRR
jgi:hypothetical protein